MQTVILSGRYLDASLRQLFGNIPASIIPVNGQVLLDRILNALPEHFRERIVIGVGEGAPAIVEHCRRRKYSDSVQFQTVEPTLSAGGALAQILERLPDEPTLILLGDTLLDLGEVHFGEHPIIFCSSELPASSGWSYLVVGSEGQVRESISDLDPGIPPPPGAQVVVGGYYLPSLRRTESAGPAVGPHRPSILEVLYSFQEVSHFRAVNTAGWYDFGHLDSYYKSKKALLVSRHFNSLIFDELRGTVRKQSRMVDKFVDEIRWYEALPQDLKILAPRVISSSLNSGQEPRLPHIELEYYGYPSLAELFVHKQLDLAFYRSILDKLFKILNLFREHGRLVSEQDARTIYLDKTLNRIATFCAQSESGRALFELETIRINGRELEGWPRLRGHMEELSASLADSMIPCFIHGDMCFSNILYDPGSGVVRLIDPRGKWSQEIGAGDQQYDLAKLRHSVVGLYDFIIANEYTLEGSGSDYSLVINAPRTLSLISQHFDNLVSRVARLEAIKTVEALLFLSMLPLHSDDPERQTALFLTGIARLNEVVNAKGSL